MHNQWWEGQLDNQLRDTNNATAFSFKKKGQKKYKEGENIWKPILRKRLNDSYTYLEKRKGKQLLFSYCIWSHKSMLNLYFFALCSIALPYLSCSANFDALVAILFSTIPYSMLSIVLSSTFYAILYFQFMTQSTTALWFLGTV